MTDMSRVDSWLDAHLEASLEELARLVAQPSISAQKLGLHECAALVQEMLRRRGFAAEVLPTGGAPVVLGERQGRSARTLLFYNHYDVQPPEPLELWDSPPFQPSRRDGKLFGRGVSDDKGHIVARLFAIDALLAVHGEVPCAVKFVIEGEEETSSVHLHEFVLAHRDRLAADACVWEFGGVDHREVPMQYLGLRGICYVELSVETAATDVHSGVGGSIIPNAAWRLTWALASLKGPDGRVRIPGFYDAVRPPSERDVALMAALPEVADEYRSRFGNREFLDGMTGGVELRIAEVFRPTCTICGLTSGYQGPGSKTVLPARASACPCSSFPSSAARDRTTCSCTISGSRSRPRAWAIRGHWRTLRTRICGSISISCTRSTRRACSRSSAPGRRGVGGPAIRNIVTQSTLL
jgi:acetylornithine deacetylase/succinyl-diaminopimelate desuccinylase-like protein